MRIFPILSICALAIMAAACEQHPLKGDPHPGEKHETHAPEVKHDKPQTEGSSSVSHGVETKSAEGTKSEEAPKFFPENK